MDLNTVFLSGITIATFSIYHYITFTRIMELESKLKDYENVKKPSWFNLKK
jgi:hypothetical protein